MLLLLLLLSLAFKNVARFGAAGCFADGDLEVRSTLGFHFWLPALTKVCRISSLAFLCFDGVLDEAVRDLGAVAAVAAALLAELEGLVLRPPPILRSLRKSMRRRSQRRRLRILGYRRRLRGILGVVRELHWLSWTAIAHGFLVIEGEVCRSLGLDLPRTIDLQISGSRGLVAAFLFFASSFVYLSSRAFFCGALVSIPFYALLEEVRCTRRRHE